MYKIERHPIISIPEPDLVEFLYNGQVVKAQRGDTIAAALHQAGYPVHSHSVSGRCRSLACGIGKCGACEMLVDGQVRRICVTKADGVRRVDEITPDFRPQPAANAQREVRIYKTSVAIIGAGPAGLACRQQLTQLGIDNIVVDSAQRIGGQFNMQTHQFFFFEKERRLGGMRGFDIPRALVGASEDGILLHTTVWDLLEGRRLALKDTETQEVSYIDADHLVVATGAVPFMPAFENDDVPGVYTAAVFQKMMNQEHTLLGRRVLTVGAGNIGYLTSYQAFQAGAQIVAIIEGMDHEGGFPVQANRVRRLGIPIMTSHVLLRAIPNADHTGITGAVIARCENFRPVAGTEQVVDGIDTINVCTGLLPDNQLLTKGREVFGFHTYACGDAVRIGEGTSAVLRGRQAAYEVAQNMGVGYDYNDYLDISRQYIDSQQRPVRLLDHPRLPGAARQQERPFVQIDCLYGFACNPCTFSCPQHAISKPTTASVPSVDYDRCIGCMQCVNHCPGLAIFGYDTARRRVFLPVEYAVTDGSPVWLVDNDGAAIGEGTVEHVIKKDNKTDVARVQVTTDTPITDIRGLILKSAAQAPRQSRDGDTPGQEPCRAAAGTPAPSEKGPTYVCHCEDVSDETLLAAVGDRKFISIDELKHTTRLGMGPCRGKRCVARARQLLRSHGIELTGEPTPRAPLASQVTLGDVYNGRSHETYVIPSARLAEREPVRVAVLIAGGGMAGSSAYRYFAEAGQRPLLINSGRGSSWRCIGGGRPAFSNPDISDIANHSLELFREIQAVHNIDLKMTRYVNLVHDDATYRSLDASRAWSDAYMIEKKDFRDVISPYWNMESRAYTHALISNNCWQATPGKTVDFLRRAGTAKGGQVWEDCELLHVQRDGSRVRTLMRRHDGKFVTVLADHFVNALGYDSERFAQELGLDTAFYPVKHQAFITQRLPRLGAHGDSLDMIIDRRHYRGFTAVYGQQFLHTGQVIGCASPECETGEARQNLKYNSQEFLKIVSEVFADWIPELASAGFRATWAGYYIEPRYVVDPAAGLLTGLRGHGFMLSQYLAKLYVDAYLGRPVPSYMHDLSLKGNGLSENAFK